MQRVHFQVRVGVFSCQDKYLFRYLWYCGKKQIECGLAWSVLLSTTIRVITVVKMLCNKLSYITKRPLCFSYWVRQQHTPMCKYSRCWISQSECALYFSDVIMQILTAKTTTMRTLYVHIVSNGVIFLQISYDIVPYARRFLPVRLFPSISLINYASRHRKM